MTRKAVLLALCCLFGAVAGANSRSPSGEDRANFTAVTVDQLDPVMRERNRVSDTAHLFPVRDSLSLLPASTPLPHPSPPLPHPSPRVSAVIPPVVRTPNPSSVTVVTVADTKVWARALLGPVQYLCLDEVFTHESHWNPFDLNRGSGAYGIPQALPGSKMAWAGADWKTNPLTQVRWGIHYMDVRYGSPCAAWSFWQIHRWY